MGEFKEFAGFLAGFTILSLIILAFVFGIVFAIPASIAFAVVYSADQKHHGPKAQLERAREETNELFSIANRQLSLTEDDLEERLVMTLHDERLIRAGLRLFANEGFLPVEPPSEAADLIELAAARNKIRAHIAAQGSAERARQFADKLLAILARFDASPSGGTFAATRPRTNAEIDALCMAFYGDHGFFKTLRRRLDQNLNEQKGVFPKDSQEDNCANAYLAGTPLLDLAAVHTEAVWRNPENHTLVLAGSGAGKTTLFKHLIATLLDDDVCIIVMDSQSQIIEELASLDIDETDVVWISPEHQLALNPFDANRKQISDEAFRNNAIAQLEFVIDKLLDAPMTPRQRTLFHHCANLVMSINGGTIETFMSVLNDPTAYQAAIDRLDQTSQRFFNEELKREGRKPSAYDGTRTELGYRLDALLKNPTLRRMFNTADNRFSMYDEMQSRKLILIDTSLAQLAAESVTFGRFMIAQALQACYRRVKEKRTIRPVVFFVDEAHEYFDEKLETMLLQARKANVGMVTATQDLARASRAGIADTLVGSTTTKIVSRIVTGYARRLAPVMKTTADYLLQLPDHKFAFASGGQPAVTVSASPDALRRFGQRRSLKALRDRMEMIYGPSAKSQHEKAVAGSHSGTSDHLDSNVKPKTKGTRSTMDENDNHDIEPTDKL